MARTGRNLASLDLELRLVFAQLGRPTLGTLIAEHEDNPEWAELSKLPDDIKNHPVDGAHGLPDRFWSSAKRAGISSKAIELLEDEVSFKNFEMLLSAQKIREEQPKAGLELVLRHGL